MAGFDAPGGSPTTVKGYLNKTDSRELGTTYTNDSDGVLIVSATVKPLSSTDENRMEVSALVDGRSVQPNERTLNSASYSDLYTKMNSTVLVPKGSTYTFSQVDSYLTGWNEAVMV